MKMDRFSLNTELLIYYYWFATIETQELTTEKATNELQPRYCPFKNSDRLHENFQEIDLEQVLL